MTTETLTITAFITARIAEDEAAARRIMVVGSCEPAFDPARVLATCKAHRELVAIATDQIRLGREARGWDNWEDMANQMLAALASIWADHEAFRDEWAL